MAYPVAVQGASIEQLLAAFPSYLKVVTELEERKIVSWFLPGRPDIEGYDRYIWYRLTDSSLAPSTGPIRHGNKINVNFEFTVVSRYFADGSQRDVRIVSNHYVTVSRLLVAFQGLHLFESTVASAPVSGVWVPPYPSPEGPPLTVEPMLISVLPASGKDQQEEGSISTKLGVILPTVLNLTVNPYT